MFHVFTESPVSALRWCLSVFILRLCCTVYEAMNRSFAIFQGSAADNRRQEALSARPFRATRLISVRSGRISITFYYYYYYYTCID